MSVKSLVQYHSGKFCVFSRNQNVGKSGNRGIVEVNELILDGLNNF